MTELFIDNQLADIDSHTEISVSLAAPLVGSSPLGRAGYSKTITIPATARNRGLMGGAEEPLASVRHNHALHSARIEVDGCTILQGGLRLSEASRGGGEERYGFHIVGEAREWVEGAKVALAELMPEWSATLDKQTIRSSWTTPIGPVMFLPLDYGEAEGNPNFYNRILTESFHPFLHVATLLRAIFAEAGYVVESEFVASPLFESLYMSGRWSERRTEGWGEAMDFLALRGENSPRVECDALGYVHADPLNAFSSVGNHVDLPDGSGGSFNGGALALDELGRLRFTPTTSLPVAFEHHLRLRTDFVLQSREQLRGFTHLYFDAADQVEIPLRNPYVDLRGGELTAGYNYTLVIFEPIEGARYTLRGEEPLGGGAAGSVRRTLTSTSSRVTTFNHSHSSPISSLTLTMELDGVEYSPQGDWAVYAGEVAERGETLLEVTLRTAPRRVTPDKPFLFQQLSFGGGREGMTLTLLKGTSTRPILVPHPIEGDTLHWSDVANFEGVSGLELIHALQELFDLRIYTDPQLRRVYIEPMGSFADPDVVVDLSDALLSSQPIHIEELGSGCRLHTLCYRGGDAAADEISLQEGEEYGCHTESMANVHAKEPQHVARNSLFAPSVSRSGVFATAPSARIIAARPSETKGPSSVALRTFVPKIVAYRGRRTLPAGESWSYLTEEWGDYPLAVFYDDGVDSAEEPLSLLYGERGGVEGLARFFRTGFEMLNHSRRISLHLHLRPEQVEQMVSPNSSKHDFRAHYLIRVGDEKVLCRLEEIADYNPASGVARATFITIG